MGSETQEKKIWLIGDTHFFHTNIIKYDNENLEKKLGYKPRPYESVIQTEDGPVVTGNVDQMNQAMIHLWNSVVKPDDSVYHLGDFFLGKSVDQARNILLQLNGKIHLVRGNHCSIDDQLQRHFEWVKDYYELSVPDEDCKGRNGKQLIVLSHYAFRVWNQSHRGSFHCYAHSHGSLPDDPNLLSMDVGCMLHGLKPISYLEVKDFMKKKTWKPIDHHGKKSEE